MTKERKKLFGLLLLLCAACIFLMACRTREKAQESNSEVADDSAVEVEEDVKQYAADEDEPLVVFYDDFKFPVVLSNFMAQHPEVKLQIYSIKGSQIEDIQETIDQYGSPDIWVMGSSASRYAIRELYEQGQVADLGPFCIEDTSLDKTEYVGGTFEVLDTGEALLGLALTWEKNCLLVRESKWQNSELMDQREQYTGEELYTALIKEFEKGRDEDELFWADITFHILYDMYELDIVQSEKDEILVDEDLFQMLYEFSLKVRKQDDAAKELLPRWEGAGSGSPDKFQGCTALDPRMYAGNFYGCTLRGAPQVVSVYAKSAVAYHGEGVHMFYVPTYESKDSYIGALMNYAMVGGQSSRQQQAYDTIRLMMDTPMITINQPEGFAAETYSPVNIELALDMLDYFDEQDTVLPIMDRVGNMFFKFDKQQLTEEEKQKIQEVIVGIKDLTFKYDDISESEIYYSYENEYVYNNGSLNTKLCYFELMRAMNPESEKWNMTPEEIAAFVNEGTKE